MMSVDIPDLRIILTDDEVNRAIDKAVENHLKRIKPLLTKNNRCKKRLTPLCPKCLKQGCKPKVKRSKLEYGNWICKRCNYIIRGDD